MYLLVWIFTFILISECHAKEFTIKLTKSEKESSVVRLHIFTSERINKTITIKYKSIQAYQFESICPARTKPLLKFIMHGFAETWNMTYRWNWVRPMIAEMLKTPEASKLCIIAVDWKELANGGSAILSNYWKAISNMQIAGDLMTEYFRKNPIDEKNMHCIGFSLGAHACGVFFQIYFNKLKIKPGRITGLDPAGPFFNERSFDEKLSLNDARFVDVIHTSARFGLDKKTGHMDFYQDNGASGVNACDDLDDRSKNHEYVVLYEDESSDAANYVNITLSEDKATDEISQITTSSLKLEIKNMFNKIKDYLVSRPKKIFLKTHQFFGCSHLMAMRFFIYSINNCEFKAEFCRSLNHFKRNKCFNSNRTSSRIKPPIMGYYADHSSEFYKRSNGNFFLRTKSEAPYCLD